MRDRLTANEDVLLTLCILNSELENGSVRSHLHNGSGTVSLSCDVVIIVRDEGKDTGVVPTHFSASPVVER